MLTCNRHLSAKQAKPLSLWSRPTLTAWELWWWRGAWGATGRLAALSSWWRQTCQNSPGEQRVLLSSPGQQCYLRFTNYWDHYAIRRVLHSVFDEVVTVDGMESGDSLRLSSLGRPELGVTFTKIHCWTLTRYSKCVFLDADTLVSA